MGPRPRRGHPGWPRHRRGRRHPRRHHRRWRPAHRRQPQNRSQDRRLPRRQGPLPGLPQGPHGRLAHLQRRHRRYLPPPGQRPRHHRRPLGRSHRRSTPQTPRPAPATTSTPTGPTTSNANANAITRPATTSPPNPHSKRAAPVQTWLAAFWPHSNAQRCRLLCISKYRFGRSAAEWAGSGCATQSTD